MKLIKKTKILLLFLSLTIGSQSAQAYWLESVTKPLTPLWKNQFATLMTLSTVILAYTCYSFWKQNRIIKHKLEKKCKKLTIIAEEFNSLNKSIAQFKHMMLHQSTQIRNGDPSSPEDINRHSRDIQPFDSVAEAYLAVQQFQRIKRNEN